VASPTVPEFGIVVCLEPDALVLRIEGELDAATAPMLRANMSDLILRSGSMNVVLDVREMTFVDSTGLQALVTALHRVESLGGSLTLRSPTRQTSKLLDLTGLGKIFVVEP
jgi:anti-sigma B factor antagonist